jgi:N-methylhydantoinase A
MRTYGHGAEMLTEVVTLRVAAMGMVPKVSLEKREMGVESAESALKGKRKAYMNEYKDYIELPIYERGRLVPGNVIKGPSIIEERESTTIIYPKQEGRIDEYSNIIIKVKVGM